MGKVHGRCLKLVALSVAPMLFLAGADAGVAGASSTATIPTVAKVPSLANAVPAGIVNSSEGSGRVSDWVVPSLLYCAPGIWLV